MAGTINGGKLAAQTNRKRYGKDFYARIGAIGGALGNTGGFFKDKERAQEVGKKGGAISKRGHTLLKCDDGDYYYLRHRDMEIVIYRNGVEL